MKAVTIIAILLIVSLFVATLFEMGCNTNAQVKRPLDSAITIKDTSEDMFGDTSIDSIGILNHSEIPDTNKK